MPAHEMSFVKGGAQEKVGDNLSLSRYENGRPMSLLDGSNHAYKKGCCSQEHLPYRRVSPHDIPPSRAASVEDRGEPAWLDFMLTMAMTVLHFCMHVLGFAVGPGLTPARIFMALHRSLGLFLTGAAWLMAGGRGFVPQTPSTLLKQSLCGLPTGTGCGTGSCPPYPAVSSPSLAALLLKITILGKPMQLLARSETSARTW